MGFGDEKGGAVMRTIHVRSFALAAAAIVSMAGSAASEEKSSGLLNTLEVRQLVARAEPGDNARLSVHFSALADQFTREAQRHKSMSQSFVGNPSRSLGTGMSAHCTRLADLNTQSANTSRELSAYHEKLAAGAAATAPRDAEKFHAGCARTDRERAECHGREGRHALGAQSARRVFPDAGEAVHDRSDGACCARAGVPRNEDRAGVRPSRPSRGPGA